MALSVSRPRHLNNLKGGVKANQYSSIKQEKEAPFKLANSIDLKMAFSDYRIEENYTPRKEHYLKLPQLPRKVYNCINNEERLVVPPDVEVELFSKYRENYFRLLCHQPKAFNKKRG